MAGVQTIISEDILDYRRHGHCILTLGPKTSIIVPTPHLKTSTRLSTPGPKPVLDCQLQVLN